MAPENDTRTVFDLLIIGGGINGAGIAADAAGRGLSVALVEKKDLASGTSSASTKLIHGGLRYLEQSQFALVKKSLDERAILLAKAPHIIQPLSFYLPHMKHLRPRWLIRLGLFLYDSLGKGMTLERSGSVRFGNDSPLVPELKRGFHYSDARVDDARLVILNARQAADNGARIFTRLECTALETENSKGRMLWRVSCLDRQRNQTGRLYARVVVNAAGPWIDRVAMTNAAHPPSPPIRLVKGSHFIVPSLYKGREAYLIQAPDDRVVFVIPYQNDFSMIGTTEEDYTGDPGEATISDAETDYLIALINRYFKHKIRKSDIVYHFSGVRPLVDVHHGHKTTKSTHLSRDYRLVLSRKPAPLLSVYGGKITTYRELAEDAMEALAPLFRAMPGNWTAHTPLPGGDFNTLPELEAALANEYPWLPLPLLQRWAQSYGTLTRALLGGCHKLEDLGQDFGHGLYQHEVDYLMQKEWALSAEDILWRRTKLGLRFTQQETEKLERYMHPADNTAGCR